MGGGGGGGGPGGGGGGGPPPPARVVHLGSTSHTSPLKVEFFKGLGLVRYLRKRADNPRRLLLAYALAPAIMLVSVLRPILRRRRG